MATEQTTGSTTKNPVLAELESYSGQYLTFKLSKEAYGVDILKVTEIIGMIEITRVPRCPSHVLGVINLRGKIIPLIDLRSRFGLTRVPYDEKTCIIVSTVKGADHKLLVGMVVDTVLEVVNIPPSMVARAPEYGLCLDTNFVMALGKLQSGETSILLDIDKVLDVKEVESAIEVGI